MMCSAQPGPVQQPPQPPLQWTRSPTSAPSCQGPAMVTSTPGWPQTSTPQPLSLESRLWRLSVTSVLILRSGWDMRNHSHLEPREWSTQQTLFVAPSLGLEMQKFSLLLNVQSPLKADMLLFKQPKGNPKLLEECDTKLKSLIQWNQTELDRSDC